GDVEIVDDDPRRGAPADDKRPGNADLPADRRADGMLDEPDEGRRAAEPLRRRRRTGHDQQDRDQPGKDLNEAPPANTHRPEPPLEVNASKRSTQPFAIGSVSRVQPRVAPECLAKAVITRARHRL